MGIIKKKREKGKHIFPCDENFFHFIDAENKAQLGLPTFPNPALPVNRGMEA